MKNKKATTRVSMVTLLKIILIVAFALIIIIAVNRVKNTILS